MKANLIDVIWKYKSEKRTHVRKNLTIYEANVLIYNIIEHHIEITKRYGSKHNLEWIRME